MTTQGRIFELIPRIMKEVGSIEKGRRNTQQGYTFRGIDDIYLGLQSHLAEHGVFYTTDVEDYKREERESRQGGTLIYTVLTAKFTFYADDGSSVYSRMVGEAMDTGDKSCNKAMSVALKYALLQIFCIPTAEPKDTENDSPEPKFKASPKPAVSPSAPVNEQAGREAIVSPDELTQFFSACAGLGFTKEAVKEIMFSKFKELTPLNVNTKLTHRMIQETLVAIRKGSPQEVKA